jgi:trehalose 6-phosphate synthase/phosphatase
MGIDYEKYSGLSKDPKIKKEIQYIRKKIGDRKIILSIDRLDYTKGISQRLESFDCFLEKYPDYKEKVTMILIVSPSRTGVQHYRVMKKQIDELIGAINGKHGTMGWVPIWYIYRYVSFQNLIALYTIADIALVTPLRDGMNLISKEFIATKAERRGVLVLSEMAGSAKELGEAIIVNPNNKASIAKALKKAFEIPEEEQISRNRVMQKRLKRYDLTRWMNDFLDSLSEIKKFQDTFSAKRLTIKIKKKLIDAYKKSKKRLILLDYDGTLTHFSMDPKKAKPDTELFKLIKTLTRNSKNTVVIISGRKRDILDKWFGDQDLNLVAEHGVWIKEKNKKWKLIEPLREEWKEDIRPMLELHVDRTPRSFIEEKDYSLVWHYRKSDPILGPMRARELKESLLQLTSNLNIGILEGSKVIEIRNANIDKGKAALHFISKEEPDFILAIGDDWTDEDVFSILPDSAHSVKVRVNPSQAKYNVESPKDVRQLLKEFIE